MKTKIKDVQHTPGPWEYMEHGSPPQGGPAFVDIFSKSGRSIARTMKGAINCDGGSMIANARLIASAPDLLRHLKVAALFYRDELKEIGGCDHSVNICCCDIIAELEDIQGTIAKAEGR